MRPDNKQIEAFRNYAHRGAELKVMTIDAVNRARTDLIAQGLGPEIVLLSEEGHTQFIANPYFMPFFDPTSKHEDLQVGYCGTFLGMEVYTDRFLPQSEWFVTGLGRVLATPESYNNRGE